MASPERKPEHIPPKPLNLQAEQPMVITDGERTVHLRRREKDDALLFQIKREETVIFTALVVYNQDTRAEEVHWKTNIPMVDSSPTPLETTPQGEPPEAAHQKQRRDEEQEYPPITLEGFPVRPARYNGQEHTYLLTIAHHPNPKNRKEVKDYYDLVAEGEKADECFAARITSTKTGVHVTGHDLSHMVEKKDGGRQLKRVIRITSLETFTGRADSPDIFREKKRLTDNA